MLLIKQQPMLQLIDDCTSVTFPFPLCRDIHVMIRAGLGLLFIFQQNLTYISLVIKSKYPTFNIWESFILTYSTEKSIDDVIDIDVTLWHKKSIAYVVTPIKICSFYALRPICHIDDNINGVSTYYTLFLCHTPFF